MAKIILRALILYLSYITTQTVVLGQDGPGADKATPAHKAYVLNLAECLGLKSDFENLYDSEHDKTRKELAEASGPTPSVANRI